MAELLVKNLFHVHDKCNGHASTTVKDVVEYSIKNGYKKIVYTEHCPLLDNGKLFRPSIDDIKQMRLEISQSFSTSFHVYKIKLKFILVMKQNIQNNIVNISKN